jgi:hypothetical protein
VNAASIMLLTSNLDFSISKTVFHIYSISLISKVKYKRFKQIKENRVKIAEERIEILKEMINKKPEYEKRYRELIKKIANKYRIKIDF